MVKTQRFHKIPAYKLDVVKLCEIKNMRFRQNGGRNIQLLTNLRHIVEKVRIGDAFVLFVHVLFSYFTVRNQFCPNSHTRIIHETDKKVNRFYERIIVFSRFSRSKPTLLVHTINKRKKGVRRFR